MKQVALIRRNDGRKFVDDINNFCKERKVIDIKFQTSENITKFDNKGVPLEAEFVDTALIIYEE